MQNIFQVGFSVNESVLKELGSLIFNVSWKILRFHKFSILYTMGEGCYVAILVFYSAG